MKTQEIKTIDAHFYRELGSKIRKLREKKDLTQRELARVIGCSRSLISDYENGYTKIKENQFGRLCNALGIDLKLSIEIRLE